LQPFEGSREIGCPGGGDAVELTYLGVGGFIIRHGGHAIMTAPFYSNPGLVRSLLGFPIEPEPARIAQFLPPVDDVEAILVGHAHYDHLMDAIHIAETSAPRATFYGSDTMAHLVHARPPLRSRTVSLEPIAGDSQTPGQWQPLARGAMRVMALRSEHGPQFLGIKAFGGTVERDLDALPRTAYGWKEGQTLAFLIDVLGADGRPALRFHYQDAPSNPPFGFPPPIASVDARAVDVSLLCVAAFNEVQRYPEGLMEALQPRHVVLAHWENFFSRRSPPAALPFLDTRMFSTRLTNALPPDARWHTPLPGAKLRFCLP
jgi:Beta-lactamase superfamily domain